MRLVTLFILKQPLKEIRIIASVLDKPRTGTGGFGEMEIGTMIRKVSKRVKTVATPIVQPVIQPMMQAVSANLRETILLRAFGLKKIPLLFFVSPSVVELTGERSVIKIPLKRRTKNHLNSMYFGALCIGADCAGGLAAMQAIDASGQGVSLIFKDFKADFLKRAEGDVLFTCEDGQKIKVLVNKALESGQRENERVSVIATVPSKLGTEPVAKFELTLSLKRNS